MARARDGAGIQPARCSWMPRSSLEQNIPLPSPAEQQRGSVGGVCTPVGKLGGCTSPLCVTKHKKAAQNESLHASGWWNSLVRSVVARDGVWQLTGSTTLAELQSSTSHEIGEET